MLVDVELDRRSRNFTYLATSEDSRVVGQELVELDADEDFAEQVTWKIILENRSNVLAVAFKRILSP